MKSAIRAMALVSVFASLASLASAQDRSASEDPSETARFHWGALRFTPSIGVSNVGVDNNVFNSFEDPKRDTTAAVGPGVNLWMHLGSARLSGKASGEYLYFKTYGNQRSWNTDDELRLELPRAHLKPFIAGSYVNTRDRPGYEIDSRSRSATNTVLLGTDLKISGKTMLQFSGHRTIIAFDQNETFLGAALAEALNRQTDTELLQLRYALTPLTTLVVNNEAIQDRFEFEKSRNADSVRVLPGFEFKPFALVSGSAFVGFRRFNALNDTIPDFNGVVASVDAKYVAAATLLRARINRDLAFSYETANPYYALTDVSFSLTERITRSWDAVGRVGWQSLDYRRNESLPGSIGRTDTGRLYGLGVGYRLGEAVRLGVDVNYAERRSQEALRQYDGLRAGASVSYGLPQ